jgi:hypothetical protein
MNFIVTLIALIIAIPQISNSIKISCDFHISRRYHVLSEVYECRVENSLTVHSPNQRIEAVSGMHFVNMSNDDVTGVRVSEKSVHFLPRGLEEFFANLELIYVGKSELREIHAGDLRPFSKLRNLDLGYNRLEIIERNLFEHNERLEVVVLRGNPLKHVHPTVFDNILRLKYLTVSGCVDERVKDNRNGVLLLVEKMKDRCFDRKIAVDEIERLSEESDGLKINLTTIRDNLKVFEEISRLTLANTKQKLKNSEANLENLQLEAENTKNHAAKSSKILRDRIKNLAIATTVLLVLLLVTSLTFLYTRLHRDENTRYDSIEKCNELALA